MAPPAGFVDACSRDADLCRELTAGYPSSARTLAYFVTADEWSKYQAGALTGFNRYLIAQAADGTPASDFPRLKDYIRSRQGDIPDHTALPSVLESRGRANLGVFEDSADAIASGVVMKLSARSATASRDLVLASTNVAFLTRDRLLSLYAYLDISNGLDPVVVKELTKEWLHCLRLANAR